MYINSRFYEIELHYPVENIKANNIQVWPLIRFDIYNSLLGMYIHKFNYEENRIKNMLLSKIRKNTNLKYNIFSLPNLLLRRRKYILFTDTLELRSFNGVIIDKISEGLFEVLGYDNFLVIENPVNGHKPINKCRQKNKVSSALISFLSYLIMQKQPTINDEDVLIKIKEKYCLNYNYRRIINRFFAYSKIYEKIFSIVKPKIIFVNCAYSLHSQAAIFVANKLGIKTVELQHGIINEKHVAYNIKKQFNQFLFPKYLFVFGSYFKRFFEKDNYHINPKNVIPTGYYYLDLVKKQYKPMGEIMRLINKWKNAFKRIIVISSQTTVESKLLDFVIDVAKSDQQDLYIFVPRVFNVENWKKVRKNNNVLYWQNEEMDIYKLFTIADIHVTVYSTCALEAIYFGLPNILVNIDNMSNLYLGRIFSKNDALTKIVNTKEEFINALHNFSNINKEQIESAAKEYHFYEQNHNQNLKEAIKFVLESKDNEGFKDNI
ncbi:MAG: hypothetical protein QXI93_02390 [Candidatus Methanomethylicia archaeon]